MTRVVAIHQPNFFPWLGYFDKLARCDVFVVLDDVQQAKTGGTWGNRVRLLFAGQPRWITAPIRRGHGVERICDVRWADVPWRSRMLTTLELAYRKATHFGEAMALLRPLVENPAPSVAQYNIAAVQAIGTALQLRPELVLASSLGVDGSSNQRLARLVRAVEGDTYLVGGGAQDYRDDRFFEEAGISVREQGFTHPHYPQRGGFPFVAGLSVIDALMNRGLADVRALLGTR